MSAEITEQVDHKAEALRLIDGADRERVAIGSTDWGLVEQLRAEALTRSNLAIAEGQERVAEAIGDYLGDGSNLDQIAQALRAIAEPEKYGIDPRSLS